MKLLAMRALRGPNIYHRKPCILMRIDLQEMEEQPSNTLPDFRARIEAIIPTLHDHRCSVGEPGGFLSRVDEGTWMGHIMEHVAIEFQCLAAMEVGYGRTRETATPGVYNVVYRYIEERSGLYAGEQAFALIEHLIAGTDDQFDLESVIQQLKELRERYRLGPSTQSIVDEAIKRGIPWVRLNNRSLVQLGHGKRQKRIQATTTSETSMIAVDIACDKEATKTLLKDAGVPVPDGEEVRTFQGALEVAGDLGYPVVVKPSDGNHGKGITVGVTNDKHLERAFEAAKKYSSYILIERQIVGKDFRALVIDHQFVAAALRVPAHVIGDGKRTIGELIDITNTDPRRGYGHEKVLTEIEVNAMTERVLEHQGLTVDSIPEKDQLIVLKSTANLSTGGTAVDITDRVHPTNISTFERISRIIGLDICGIDVIAENLHEPLAESGGGVIEVNAAPGFRMHLAPSEGIGRNVAESVIDMLFPDGEAGRIPVIAVTGTNGKTTTTRLLARIMRNQGRKVGFTTTDGVYIDGSCVMPGDMTGPFAAGVVLRDPTIDFAVLECARGGLLRRGLGFRFCDIGIVLNVTEDHLGLSDIETLDDLARVKRVIVEIVRPEGWAVLNADDEHVAAMKEYTPGSVAYFSMDENNDIIRSRMARGKTSCVYENDYITILNGSWKIRIAKANEIPLTMGGRATFMIQNVLAASLAAYLAKVKPASIRQSLMTFVPGHGTTPGRLNHIQVHGIDILIDFAHNPTGYRGLAGLIARLPAERKLATISACGDRRDIDIEQMGQIAAEMFTEIVIRESPRYRRGRAVGAIADLLERSILDAGFPAENVRIAADEPHAVRQVLETARRGDLVVIIADDIDRCHEEVERFKERVESHEVTRADIPNVERYDQGAREPARHGP